MTGTQNYHIAGIGAVGETSIIAKVVINIISILKEKHFMGQVPENMSIVVKENTTFSFNAPKNKINVTNLFNELTKCLSCIIGSTVTYAETKLEKGGHNRIHIQLSYSMEDIQSHESKQPSRFAFTDRSKNTTLLTPKLNNMFEETETMQFLKGAIQNQEVKTTLFDMVRTVVEPTVFLRFYDTFILRPVFVRGKNMNLHVSGHSYVLDHYVTNSRLQEWVNKTGNVLSAEMLLDADKRGYEISIVFREGVIKEKQAETIKLVENKPAPKRKLSEVVKDVTYDSESEYDTDNSEYETDYETDNSEYETDDERPQKRRRRPDTPGV